MSGIEQHIPWLSSIQLSYDKRNASVTYLVSHRDLDPDFAFAMTISFS